VEPRVMDGVLGVDKARGPTSHDGVQRLRHLLSVRRVGHAGTLDPDASGVLVLCIGKATKVSRFLMEGRKEYRATLRLGFRTHTGDRTGDLVGPVRPVRVRADEIHAACRRWVGEIEQTPPMVSAVKQGGVRLYRLARAGVEVDRSPRRVRITSIEVLGISLPLVTIRVRCTSGTYIRVLAEDIGSALGCGAHLFSLRRTRVGDIGLERCVRWNDLDRATRDLIRGSVLSLDAALAFLPDLRMDERDTRRIRTGLGIRPGADRLEGVQAGWIRLKDPAGELVAVGSLSDDLGDGRVTIKPARVLSPWN
jgi:tRNA pseudouridine55 synthase